MRWFFCFIFLYNLIRNFVHKQFLNRILYYFYHIEKEYPAKTMFGGTSYILDKFPLLV